MRDINYNRVPRMATWLFASNTYSEMKQTSCMDNTWTDFGTAEPAIFANMESVMFVRHGSIEEEILILLWTWTISKAKIHVLMSWT